MKTYKTVKIIFSGIMGMFLDEESIFFLRSPDKYIRYNEIIRLINEYAKKNKSIAVLDVGGGDESLCDFLSRNNVKITILDISEKELGPARQKGYDTVLADASKKIPFKDNSFDIVTSVASLEHVPPERRDKYCDELKRVARSRVLLYVQSGKAAEKYDRKLYRFSKSLGIPDPWTEEHIRYGLPSGEDLKKYFPRAEIRFIQNARVWYATILLTKIPFANLVLPGLIYSIFLKSFDKCKPHIGAIVDWNKKK